MDKSIAQIGQKFEFEGIVNDIRPLGEGLINDTFVVETQGEAPNYILQRKNKSIFLNIPAMMSNIQTVSLHLKKKIVTQGGDPMREALTVTPTKDGKLYFEDDNGEYWAACYLIPNAVTHHKADSLKLAYEGGAGIGKFQAMLADMTQPLTNILPGFHDMRFRFEQWDEVLTKDPIGRKAGVKREIEWIECRRDEMLVFWSKIESGEIPMRVTHNDTKISNMLFDSEDNVLAVIDLDTVLNSTCLNDYGDAIRSYTNTGLEDDEDLSNVSVDMAIYEAYTEGYLSEVACFLTPSEISNVAFSAKFITFEQVLRFLMDYIDGDKYYKVKNDKHNLIRTRAQYKLLQSIDENYEQMCQIVTNQIKKHRK